MQIKLVKSESFNNFINFTEVLVKVNKARKVVRTQKLYKQFL